MREYCPRWAWWPLPTLALAVMALWVADPRTVHESSGLLLLLTLVLAAPVALCIGLLAGRGFLAGGQPGLVMFGSGALFWGLATLAACVLVRRGANSSITVHNLGLLAAAVCHLAGLYWRRRLQRPGLWLAACYAGVPAVVALLVWGATAGWTPVFFVQGQGGTPVRQVVVGAAITVFGLAAWRLLTSHRRQPSAFCCWYGLGLALMAVGLAGVLLQAVHGGVLGWTARGAQLLGGAYLLAAAVAAARQVGAWRLSPAGAEEKWRKVFVPSLLGQAPRWWVLRYGAAVLLVAAAFGLRQGVTAVIGPGLPTYITFYPAVMVAALLAGFGPGVLGTALTVAAVALWVVAPGGRFAIPDPVDRFALALFSANGVFMSAVAELYRRYRREAAAYQREAALSESRARLAAFAEATFEGIVESEGGSILDCNEQFARMLGCSLPELKGVGIAGLIAPEDRERVMASIRQGRESVIEHALLRRDGRRIIVEAHGRPVSAGGSRRHTALRDITERRQNEEALRRSEEHRRVAEAVETERRRLYEVLETLPTMVCLLTPDHQVVFANRSHRDRFGEFRGRRCHEYRFGSGEPCGFCESFEVLETGRPHRWELTAPDGGVIDVYDFPFTDVDGSPMVLEMDIDISERRRSEVELARHRRRLEELVAERTAGLEAANARLQAEIAERRLAEAEVARTHRLAEQRAGELEAVLQAVPAAVWIAHDPDCRHITGNRAAGALLRLPEGAEASLTAPPGDRPTHFKVFAQGRELAEDELPLQRAARGVEVREFEEEIVFADGTVVPALGNATPLWDEEGRPRGAVGVFLDIRERKLAEERLLAANERLSLAQRSSGAGVWDWDLATDRLEWSPELFQLFGLEPGKDAATLETWRGVLHPDDLKLAEARIEQAIRDRTQLVNEYRIVLPSGEIRWINAIGNTVCDVAGRATRMSGICIEVTERKQAEETLRRTAEELARSNRELEQFAYVVSHDLQEPLRMVTAFGRMLRERCQGSLDAKGHQYLAFTIEGAERMQALVRDLLAYGRVSGEALELSPTPVQEALDVALANLRAAIEESGASVTQDPLPTVLGDGRRLRQVFQNLIGNAIKFRREGVGPRVHVAVRRVWRDELRGETPGPEGDQGTGDAAETGRPGPTGALVLSGNREPAADARSVTGDSWLFTVRDNGIGIDPRHAETVFQLFQRLHPREKYPGTGIGLAICKRIVERHGGWMWVESAPGRGSGFHFILPAAGRPGSASTAAPAGED